MPVKHLSRPVTVLPMTAEHVKEVHAIERDCFPCPWPRKAFLSALRTRETRFFAALEEGKVVGYAGIRLGSCAHILNIAVHWAHRRREIGSRLLSFLLELAARHEARRVTLEVRASNTIAQTMYRQFGFAPIAIRRGYYTRKNEDAIVMAKKIGSGGSWRRPSG